MAYQIKREEERSKERKGKERKGKEGKEGKGNGRLFVRRENFF